VILQSYVSRAKTNTQGDNFVVKNGQLICDARRTRQTQIARGTSLFLIPMDGWVKADMILVPEPADSWRHGNLWRVNFIIWSICSWYSLNMVPLLLLCYVGPYKQPDFLTWPFHQIKEFMWNWLKEQTDRLHKEKRWVEGLHQEYIKSAMTKFTVNPIKSFRIYEPHQEPNLREDKHVSKKLYQ